MDIIVQQLAEKIEKSFDKFVGEYEKEVVVELPPKKGVVNMKIIIILTTTIFRRDFYRGRCIEVGTGRLNAKITSPGIYWLRNKIR